MAIKAYLKDTVDGLKLKLRQSVPFNFITVDGQSNSIAFTIQDGTVAESGVNGCQVIDMVVVAREILSKFNEAVPSRETSMIITKLDEAIMWDKKRTEDRELRKVEGTYEK